MTIEKWLADVYYDDWSTFIWSRESDGDNHLIAEIRGWGRLQNEFPNTKDAEVFQNELGKFIVQAIREKIARTSSQPELSDEEIEKYANERVVVENVFVRGISAYYLSEGAKWYREQLKKKQ